MARRSDKLREELAALDQDVIRDRGAARRIHKAIPAVGAFVAMVGFGAVTWYAYNQGILEGSEDAAPLLRPKGALKAQPSNPGGVYVPNRDKYKSQNTKNKSPIHLSITLPYNTPQMLQNTILKHKRRISHEGSCPIRSPEKISEVALTADSNAGTIKGYKRRGRSNC